MGESAKDEGSKSNDQKVSSNQQALNQLVQMMSDINPADLSSDSVADLKKVYSMLCKILLI